MTDHSFVYHPRPPRLELLDPEQVQARYDLETDTLMVTLSDPDRPAISYFVDENLYLPIDPRDGEIVGLHVEGYLTGAVRRNPALILFAGLAGVPWEAVVRLLYGLPRSEQQLALDTVLTYFAPNEH